MAGFMDLPIEIRLKVYQYVEHISCVDAPCLRTGLIRRDKFTDPVLDDDKKAFGPDTPPYKMIKICFACCALAEHCVNISDIKEDMKSLLNLVSLSRQIRDEAISEYMKRTSFEVVLCGSINDEQFPPNWNPLIRHLRLGVWRTKPGRGSRIDYDTAVVASFSQWFNKLESLETLQIGILGERSMMKRRYQNMDEEILKIFSSIRTKAMISFRFEHEETLTDEGRKALVDLLGRQD
ncbi:MAG: hypothetical protein Q9165_006805 [Trypethelium subeluteriae]